MENRVILDLNCYDSIKNEYESLKNEYESLKNEYESLKSKYYINKKENNKLRYEYCKLIGVILGEYSFRQILYYESFINNRGIQKYIKENKNFIKKIRGDESEY